MKVIPWFEYGLMEPAISPVVQQHPKWLLTKADGNPIVVLHNRDMV